MRWSDTVEDIEEKGAHLCVECRSRMPTIQAARLPLAGRLATASGHA
jgi:predicted Zn-dependent protease